MGCRASLLDVLIPAGTLFNTPICGDLGSAAVLLMTISSMTGVRKPNLETSIGRGIDAKRHVAGDERGQVWADGQRPGQLKASLEEED